ncbi:hypothetical protein A7K91_07955 [Paenibacillus oryzae]|uniref:VWFA domain-containing protein n=1 Tax=Paenibacillus oryzae TaxID=1844972 RepID=A0A1A5YE70_9BACL|nr:stalk domain-containing protein [Paenibacillus oryzae]OBR63695.1 hypothetical protein A7K91_07955 [Paenibacillus oryzae]
MKLRKMLLFMLVSTLIVASLGLHSVTVVQAAGSLEYREHDNLVNILQDGDGENRVFRFATKNKLTAANTTLRLYINAIEANPNDYVVDYDNNTITLAKAPYSGAEIHIKYGIIPGFEWEEGQSGTPSIGIALSGGDGSARTFSVPVSYTLSSAKNVSLYINGSKVSSSRFTFNAKTKTVTLSEKQQAPYTGSSIYFYIPKASITGAPTSPGGATENPAASGPPTAAPTSETATGGPSPAAPTPRPATGSPSPTSLSPGSTPNGTARPTPVPGTAASPTPTSAVPTMPSPGVPVPTPAKTEEPLPNVPTGAGYPGTIEMVTGNIMTVYFPATAASPDSYSYLMVKNASGQVVRQIKIEAGGVFSFSLAKLGLPTGGYYSYLKTVNQSGGLSASVPQFITINHEPKHIQVYIEGVKQVYEQPPVNAKGNVLVPLRSIFESLGATVKWNSSTQTVTATRGGRTVVLTIGSKTAYINGVAVTLSAAPQLINGSTMVPVRFVSEAFGGEVEWKGETGSVIVFQNKPSIPTSAESENPPAGAEKTTEPEKTIESESASSPTILKNISKGITAPSDIVFVIDVTGSMGEVIDYIKETVKSFVDSVPAGSNFSVVAYRDINYYEYGYPDMKDFDFTRDKDKLKGYLNKLVAYGGGDDEESGLEAIHTAAYILSELGSANDKRIIFVTDAAVHESRPMSDYTIKATTDMLKENNIIVDAIAPKSGYVHKQINQLVQSNPGGVLYDIKNASVMLLNE